MIGIINYYDNPHSFYSWSGVLMGYEKTRIELLQGVSKFTGTYFAGIANTGIFELKAIFFVILFFISLSQKLFG
jgi:hypothetical protein